MDLDPRIDEALRRAVIRRQMATIEDACEEAMVMGFGGVLIEYHVEGTMTARHEPGVPYGHIHIVRYCC